jgi:hypothetical protein
MHWKALPLKTVNSMQLTSKVNKEEEVQCGKSLKSLR